MSINDKQRDICTNEQRNVYINVIDISPKWILVILYKC